MCSRYRVKKDKKVIETLAEHFPDADLEEFVDRWNLAPTQKAPVLLNRSDGWKITSLHWGLVPSWAKDTRMAGNCINARSETVDEKPSFRDAFRERRCLVLAHGYYEWETIGKGKQPWHFSRKHDELMCFAGLWESWQPTPVQDELLTFSILTTEPNELAAKWHDRMPVILPSTAWKEWMNPAKKTQELKCLLQPYDAADMDAWAVTTRMNSSRFESSECIQRLPGPDEFRLEAY